MEHNNNSKVIIPQPGFVVKGVHGNSHKIFVNVCFSPDIGPAEESSDGRVRVPMSIGDLVDDLDMKLNPCKTVDIIVNEASVVRASDDTEFKKSFVEFLLAGVETKHKVKLERIRAMKIGYKGDSVKSQRIRLDKPNFVTEIPLSGCDLVGEPPEFSYEMVNESTGERFNVFELPQYKCPKLVLQANLQRFLGVSRSQSLENGVQAKRHRTVDFLRFQKAKIVIEKGAGIKLKISSRRVLVLSSRLSVSPAFSIWFPVRMDVDSAIAEYCKQTGQIKVSISVLYRKTEDNTN
jgi:hypothetical protein